MHSLRRYQARSHSLPRPSVLQLQTQQVHSLAFTNGIYATASSTIGGGTQASGLTINGGATTTGTLTVPNAGLRLFDTDASNFLTINNSSDLTANRTLTVSTGDANRTLTLNGNITTGGNFTIAGGSLTLTLAATTNVNAPNVRHARRA